MSRRVSLLICGLFTCALLLTGASTARAATETEVTQEKKKPKRGLGQKCSKKARCKKGLACRMGDNGKVCKKKKGKGKKVRAKAKKQRRKGKKRRGAARILDKVDGGLDSVAESIQGVGAIEDRVRNLGGRLKRLLDATKRGRGK